MSYTSYGTKFAWVNDLPAMARRARVYRTPYANFWQVNGVGDVALPTGATKALQTVHLPTTRSSLQQQAFERAKAQSGLPPAAFDAMDAAAHGRPFDAKQRDSLLATAKQSLMQKSGVPPVLFQALDDVRSGKMSADRFEQLAVSSGKENVEQLVGAPPGTIDMARDLAAGRIPHDPGRFAEVAGAVGAQAACMAVGIPPPVPCGVAGSVAGQMTYELATHAVSDLVDAFRSHAASNAEARRRVSAAKNDLTNATGAQVIDLIDRMDGWLRGTAYGPALLGKKAPSLDISGSYDKAVAKLIPKDVWQRHEDESGMTEFRHGIGSRAQLEKAMTDPEAFLAEFPETRCDLPDIGLQLGSGGMIPDQAIRLIHAIELHACTMDRYYAWYATRLQAIANEWAALVARDARAGTLRYGELSVAMAKQAQAEKDAKTRAALQHASEIARRASAAKLANEEKKKAVAIVGGGVVVAGLILLFL